MIDQAIKSGSELPKLRGRLGMTQADLAKALGMTTRAVQMLEAGASKVRPIHSLALEALSVALAVERKDPTLALPRMRRAARLISD